MMIFFYGNTCLSMNSAMNIVAFESHAHLVKSQRYQGLKMLLSDTKFMTTINPMFIYHRFQEN